MENRESGEAVKVELKRPGGPLVISFAGLGDEFEFYKTFAPMDVNVIYLRDLRHHWYLNGLDAIGNDPEALLHWLKERITVLQPSKVITIGVSAGGFAALLYGSLLNANHILSFSPQTFMDKFHRLVYYDYRWKDRVSQIYKGPRINRQYLDVKKYLSGTDAEIRIFYDRHHRLDRWHGQRIRGKKVIRFVDGGGGHNMAKVLRDSGELVRQINLVLEYGSPQS